MIAQDPSLADAHAALAMIEIENFRTMTADVGDPRKLDRATQHAVQAVRRDPLSATGHLALALANFHAKRFVDFRASAKRALLLNPCHSDMLAMLGMCFVRRAQWDEGMPLVERALVLDPLCPDWYHMPKAMFLMMTKGPEEAIAEYKKRPMPDFFAYHAILLWFHVEVGDMSWAEFEKTLLLQAAPDAESFMKRYFDAICLCDDIAERALAAFARVGLRITG
ncbi:hypothetical protein E4Z66_08230 [Aliishimia ponticola]|uniref:Uncharacterized protein n=1 Tax=Aliishimia ponticola TaxID=2499833 RepID=A0A4S4NC33_9RHOB|nr:hypothetical protein [Aliishimia ponticola]THH36919.1 hypothetical protein E4Z66_08230 [Aliishimia ponticola]